MSGVLRQPRSIVTVNGGRMAFESWESNNNGYYQADTFTVKFVLNDAQAAWWSEQTILEVMIYDGFPADPANFTAADLTLRIQGRADSAELDPIRKTVHVTGRDYTSKLIDTKVPPPDPNATASGVAKKFAAQYGLGYSVTPTSTKIGAYYQLDHVSMKVEKSAWDILTYLAHQEQFIVYVTGKILHFGPKPDPANARVLTLDNSQRITGAPAPELRFIRNLTLAHGIAVYVRSWNDKQKKGFTKVARSKRTKDPVTKRNQPLTGEEQVYSYTIPNLTPVAAQAEADSRLASISQHEVRFTADDMPGDPTLDPFQPVRWLYNGTMYAQTYFLESVVRSFSFQAYTMSIRGKNHSVESVVLA